MAKDQPDFRFRPNASSHLTESVKCLERLGIWPQFLQLAFASESQAHEVNKSALARSPAANQRIQPGTECRFLRRAIAHDAGAGNLDAFDGFLRFGIGILNRLGIITSPDGNAIAVEQRQLQRFDRESAGTGPIFTQVNE